MFLLQQSPCHSYFSVPKLPFTLVYRIDVHAHLFGTLEYVLKTKFSLLFWTRHLYNSLNNNDVASRWFRDHSASIEFRHRDVSTFTSSWIWKQNERERPTDVLTQPVRVIYWELPPVSSQITSWNNGWKSEIMEWNERESEWARWWDWNSA